MNEAITKQRGRPKGSISINKHFQYIAICNHYLEHLDIKAAAATFSINQVNVYAALKRNGIKLVRPKNPAINKRHEQIIAFYKENHTLQETGNKFGVTRERVRQILNTNGIKPRNNWRVPEVDKTLPLEQQFWLRVAVTDNIDDCWLWLGGTISKGYGSFGYKGKRYLTHVYSLSLALGRPVKKFALHHCDNPPCCNPNHLFEGTAKDNADDMISKGRAGFQKDYDSWYKNMIAGKKTHVGRLCKEEVLSIRAKIEQGVLMKYIASEHSLTIGMISHIKSGRCYKHFF